MKRPKRSSINQMVRLLQKDISFLKNKQNKLQITQAKHGIDTPPHVLIEIEEINSRIDELSKEVRRLDLLTVELDPEADEIKKLSSAKIGRKRIVLLIAVLIIIGFSPLEIRSLFRSGALNSSFFVSVQPECSIAAQILNEKSGLQREAELIIYSDRDRGLSVKDLDSNDQPIQVLIYRDNCKSIIFSPGDYLIDAGYTSKGMVLKNICKLAPDDKIYIHIMENGMFPGAECKAP